MDGQPIKLFAIGGECVDSKEPRCVAFQPKLNVASGVRILPAEYDLYADKDLEVRFPAKGGPAQLTVAFVERYATMTEGGGAARKPLTQWQSDTGEGLMAMDFITIEGPVLAEGAGRHREPAPDLHLHPQGAAGRDGLCAQHPVEPLQARLSTPGHSRGGRRLDGVLRQRPSQA